MRVAACLLFALSLNADPKKIDALFAPWNRTDSPGYSVAVIRDGKTIFAKGYGMADLERRVAISPQSVFDIGSTSKQFTAASILLLEQDGKLALDDDIRKYFPEMRAYQRPVTIRHLLHHTSGLRDYLTIMWLGGLSQSNDYTDEETLAWIVSQRALNFAPGDDHLYSNSGYYLLGQLVERASGMTLREFARTRIFQPLGMTSTHFHDNPREIVPHRAIGYAEERDGFAIEMSGYHVVGDGGVFTTTEDLAKWDANFYEPKVGGARFLESLHRRGVLTSGKTIDYAAGLFIETRDDIRSVAHGGAWAGYRSEMLRFPDQRLTVIILSNLASADPSGLAEKVAALYLDRSRGASTAPAESERVTVEVAELRKHEGIYYDEAGAFYRRVEVRDGTLWHVRGSRSTELVPIAGGIFALGTSPARIRFRDGVMELEAAGEPPSAFRRITVVQPSPAELAAYEGVYRSEEIASPHRLRVRDGQLYVRAGYNEEQLLTPRERDVFESPEGVIVRFHRNNRGRVESYTVSAGRVRGIRMERTRTPVQS